MYFFILAERQTQRCRVKECMTFLANSLISIFSVHLPLAGFPVGGPWTLLRQLWTSTHCSTQPLFFGRSTILQVSLCHALPSLSMLLCSSSIPIPISGLIHPYWSRINSEKTCPLMVFWNLSVWAFNGAENWIVPKDCWAKKKMSVGGFFCGAGSRSLLTNHRDCINCTIHSIDAEFSRQWFGSDFSCAQFHRSKICHEWHLAIWKVRHQHQVCVVYVARERLIMYACSLPGLFIRALMRNKKRKRDLKFRPDPGLMFYLERRGWVTGGVWVCGRKKGS